MMMVMKRMILMFFTAPKNCRRRSRRLNGRLLLAVTERVDWSRRKKEQELNIWREQAWNDEKRDQEIEELALEGVPQKVPLRSLLRGLAKSWAQ